MRKHHGGRFYPSRFTQTHAMKTKAETPRQELSRLARNIARRKGSCVRFAGVVNDEAGQPVARFASTIRGNVWTRNLEELRLI
jgi:hypothetical protein